MKVDMELLAPAGNVENFHAALEAGADAVYIGAPGINARNLSRDLRLEEIGAMIDFAHSIGKKVYIAANSIILEKELASLVETLTLLEYLAPDAVIVQDLALIRLIREFFPDIRLHASTLMGGHNSDIVQILAEMGCKRVVLARELTLKEIEKIVGKASVEIEVFVHGAMCYSYSGLCLFSSFLGGKSGMRGRCVQPCRRGYSWQGQGKGARKKSTPSHQGGGSYLFSMNDLEAFEAIEFLKEAKVSSLKIEGRLRSASYVSKIVAAYRLVMDAADSERKEAIVQARILAEEAMARKTSSGYFFSPQPQQAIVPYHSGNMGTHLGSFSLIRKEKKRLLGAIKLKKVVNIGDRLRLHIETTGERKAFTLHFLQKDGVDVDTCSAGNSVRIAIPEGLEEIERSKVELYKVDEKKKLIGKVLSEKDTAVISKRLSDVRKKENGRITSLQRMVSRHDHMPVVDNAVNKPLEKRNYRGQTIKKERPKGLQLEWWLKTDSAKLVFDKMPFSPDMLLLNMDKEMISQSGRIKKYFGRASRQVIWSLPPVILENDLVRQHKQINILIRSGFKSFQIAHLGQITLFGKERVRLYGDYTLNLANSQALEFASRAGFEGTQLAIELDRESLSLLVRAYGALVEKLREEAPLQKMRLGLTVYGTPPLFTSRLSPSHFQFNKNLVSPKGEEFFIKKHEGTTLTVSAKPFSLLPYLREIQEIGIDYVVVDLTNMRQGEKELTELAGRISGTGKWAKLPTFNYQGKLE